MWHHFIISSNKETRQVFFDRFTTLSPLCGSITNRTPGTRGGGGNLHMSCCDMGMCHYFGYFFRGCSQIFGYLFGLFPGFLGIIFWLFPDFWVSFFWVKFDFFLNNPDFVVLILIFPSMILWNVACRALVSMILQFLFLFYYACAKSSILSITAISLSSYICSAFRF